MRLLMPTKPQQRWGVPLACRLQRGRLRPGAQARPAPAAEERLGSRAMGRAGSRGSMLRQSGCCRPRACAASAAVGRPALCSSTHALSSAPWAGPRTWARGAVASHGKRNSLSPESHQRPGTWVHAMHAGAVLLVLSSLPTNIQDNRSVGIAKRKLAAPASYMLQRASALT